MSAKNKHCGLCVDCKHYHIQQEVNDGWQEVCPGMLAPKKKTIPAYCDIHPIRCKRWWRDNGDKHRDEAQKLDCFEFTEHAQRLQNLIDEATQLLEEVKKQKNT